MTWQQSLILGIIEGLTEFLPISSTGHMIIASHFMQMNPTEFHKAFEVIIQFGAILSVLLLYWKKFLVSSKEKFFKFYSQLFFAFIPTAIIGFLLKDIVSQMMESLTIVSWSLIVGGVVLYFSDSYFAKNEIHIKSQEQLHPIELIKIGLYQCLSLIPGVSRSGATIMGGLSLGLSRKEAAEFSFFLAVPTMAAATGYKLLKVAHFIDSSQINILLIGLVTAFIVATVSIKFMMKLVQKFGFKIFGIYRILLGTYLLFF